MENQKSVTRPAIGVAAAVVVAWVTTTFFGHDLSNEVVGSLSTLLGGAAAIVSDRVEK